MGNAAWLYWLFGGLASTAGLGALYCTLLRDRSRGRRRCPRCWYDMAGVPGLRCPECGSQARSERRFFKTRRRWRSAAAGFVVLALGSSMLGYPLFSARGIYAFAPTEVLIALAPDAGRESLSTARQAAAMRELQYRIDEHKLNSWQWPMLLRQTNVVRYRRVWPRTLPLVIEVQRPGWLDGVAPRSNGVTAPVFQLGSGIPASGMFSLIGTESRVLRFFEADGQARLPSATDVLPSGSSWPGGLPARPQRISLAPCDGATAKIRLEVGVLDQTLPDTDGALWAGVLATVRLVDDPAHAIPPCDKRTAEEMTPRMRCIVRARHPRDFAAKPAAEVGVQFDCLPATVAESVAVGVDVQLRRDGEIVDTVAMLLTPGPLACLHGPYLEGEIVSCLTRFSDAAAASIVDLDQAQIARWSVRVVGNPMIAVQDLAKPTHWPADRDWALADVLVVPTPTRLFVRGSEIGP